MRKGILKRETESILITAQNNIIRNKYIKVKIDNTQQNSKWGDKDETVNHIISECSKLVQRSIILDTTGWGLVGWLLGFYGISTFVGY